MLLKIRKLNPKAIIPTRVHPGDLGFDLYADKTIVVQAGQTVLASTGISCGFPCNWGGIVKARSSQGKAGIDVLGGVIDSGYTGEIGVLLYNTADPSSEGHIIYNAGDKIGQLILVPVFEGDTIEVDELDETSRGAQGFGSSGR